MTKPFNKSELQALIESTDARIAKLKLTNALTAENAQENASDLRKLEAARRDLVDQLRLAAG